MALYRGKSGYILSPSVLSADFSQLIRMLPTLCTYTLETQVIPEDGNYYMDPLLDYALTGVDFRSASTLMKQMIYG